MSQVAKLLNDPKEFVRMHAQRTMVAASSSAETHLALLNATIAKPEGETMSPNNFHAWVQNPLFGTKDSKLSESPFDAGFDEELIQNALERLLEMDPIGNRGFLRSRAGIWSKDTVVRLAGPLTYVAENEQMSDHMFAGRHWAGQKVLSQHGYYEAIQASANYLRENAQLPRDLRPKVNFKRPMVNVDMIKANPGACKEILGPLKLWLSDDPLATISEKKGNETIVTKVQSLVSLIENAEPAAPLPSLATDVERFYQARLAQHESIGEKLAMCRVELSDPARRNYFRKMEAMDYLTEILDIDVMEDLIPYLGHDYWRLRNHSRKLVSHLTRVHGPVALMNALPDSEPQVAAGILSILAESDAKQGLDAAKQALSHDSGIVRQAAVQTVFALGGDESLRDVLTFMKNAKTQEDLRGCEQALLSRPDDAEHAQRVRSLAIRALPVWPKQVQPSLYWVLAQLGGQESLTALYDAAENGDDSNFQVIVNALTYSPDPAASALLLRIVKENLNTPRAVIAAREGVRRMVIGRDDIGTLSNKERLDYAEPLLNMVLDPSTITYLGNIKSGRCALILTRAMRRGIPGIAAKAIVDATADLKDAPAADRKLAAEALVDTIEFIEVTQLRGGATDQLKANPEAWRTYAQWKAVSVQAGKNLLKLDKPEEAPLPEFNDLDLDL